QTNWIGRSEGAELAFPVEGHAGEEIRFFTTRPDTIYGATFMVLAPEHPLVAKITAPAKRAEVERYVETARNMAEIERTSAEREKTGVDTGALARNVFTGERIPIWVADYVLATYGTRASMAVAGHGERVIGGPSVIYRLRDWLISRQRYWGTPIPIVHCERCGPVPVPYEQLPVVLPRDVEFTGRGGSPLSHVASFVNTTCPKCSGPARRDTDTMDTFVDSSWYMYRYGDVKYDASFMNKKLGQTWLPGQQYPEGAEQEILHPLSM